jgi:hypothetical protein
MNARNILLGIFVVATVLFASLTVVEYAQINSQITRQLTSSTSTTCTATGGIGCLHFLNDRYTISVSYGGPWGLTYQAYLGDSPSGQPVKSGNFYGHSPTNETVAVAGTSAIGTTLCAEAQKLDASNSTTLVLRIASSTNQTSAAYGTTKICIANEIA